jgi:thiosulfate/3-mercaptopyruvate sulfurtransferase
VFSPAAVIMPPTALLRNLSRPRVAVGLLARAMSSQAAAPLLLAPRDVKDPSSVVFLDSSWHMPGSPRNARAEYAKKHIPGARYLDLDAVASSHELGLKHMMPTGSVFAQSMGAIFTECGCVLLIRSTGKLGITPSTHVVV